jgi:hypothetical protein
MTTGEFDANYDVPARNYSWLSEKIQKLNNRAEKLGVEPIIMKITSERLVQISKEPWEQVGRQEKFYTVNIRGATPVLSGWKFIGTLQHIPDNGNTVTILRAVPGESLADYRGAPNWCDHCKTSRRRNDTFVVRRTDDDGVDVLQQVGRQCLKDFLGNADPHKLADWAESLSLLSDLMKAAGENMDERGRGGLWFRMEGVVVLSAEVIRRFGWTSHKMAKDAEEKGGVSLLTTSNRVRALLYGTSPLEQREWDAGGPITDESKAVALAALEWVRTEVPAVAAADPDNDYLYNLVQIGKLEAIEANMIGITVSLVSAYQRELKRRAAPVTSEHVGTVGLRETFTLMVAERRNITYGDGTPGIILKFVDLSGNSLAWFTGSAGKFVQGKTYRVKATIKRHDEFRGVKQTTLNRVNILEELAA